MLVKSAAQVDMLRQVRIRFTGLLLCSLRVQTFLLTYQ